MMLSLYDRPGSYLVDHPNAKKQIKRIVAATTATVAAATLAVGGLGQYGISFLK